MIVGIDLGTTNSAVACWKDGQATLIPNSLGHVLTPSAVSFSDSGSLLVGLPARERQVTDPEYTATLFKRYMGTNKRYTIGKKTYSPEDMSSLVLSSLKADAERFLGTEVTSAVITVPAYFNDKQRRATRQAGELAGLKVERLVNEPTAAALAYGIHESELEEPFLIFDLGGGTFDVSLVEMFDGIVEVRASAGDNRLGGEDFNEALVGLVNGRLDFGEITDRDQILLDQNLRYAAERVRRKLTEAASVEFRCVWKDQEYTTEITADEFAEACGGLIARLREPVVRSLRDSSIRASELAQIILVGGATRMPVVRRAVAKLFGRFPNASIDPDQVVALGAGVLTGLLAKNEELKEVRLTDVCPFTLGVEIAERDARGGMRNGIFSPIIERNTVIPASRVRSYENLQDNQDRILLDIYQGEAREVADNIKIGSVDLPIPRRKAGEVCVDCRFTYDTSGLLEVDVSVEGTDIKRQALIYDTQDRGLVRDLENRRALLAKLKVHPRDQAENAAALARSKRSYEGQLGNIRDYVGRLIGDFEAVLVRQDEREIATARKELLARLDEVEGEDYL